MEDQLDLIIKQNKQKEDLHGEANLLLEEVALKGAKSKDIKDLTESVKELKPEMKKVSGAAEFISNFLEVIKGEKGEDAQTPEKGKDYFTDSEIKEIIDSVLEKIPTPEDGKDGIDGIDGQDGRDGVDGKDGLDGENGKDAVINYDEVVKQVVKKLPKIEKVTPKTVEAIISEMKGKLSYNDLADLPTIFSGHARDYDFIELKDVPKSYKGQAGKSVSVKADESGLEFTTNGIGDVIGPASARDNKVAVFNSTTGKLIKEAVVATVGADANFTDFPNAAFIASKGDSGHSYTNNIGIVGESLSAIGYPGIGVGGVSKTNGIFPAYGVAGRALVGATGDSGGAIGVQGLSEATHAGGSNIAFYAQAANGLLNYSFYGNTGKIYNASDIQTATGLISPKLYPAADSTTALQILKANGTTCEMNFNTNNDRVSIGITPGNEQHKLQVAGSLAVSNAAGTDQFLVMSTSGTAQKLEATYNLELKAVNGNILLTPTAAGFVGVGIAAPDTKLGVNGLATFYNVAPDDVNNPLETIRMSFNAGGSTAYRNSIFNMVSSTSNTGLMQFRINTGADTQATVMSLRGNGTVGIGTVTPGAKLEVVGGGILIGTAGQSLSWGSGDGTTYIYGDPTNPTGRLSLGTGAADRLSILYNGNVGVGTIAPAVKFTLQQADQVYAQLGVASLWDMALGIAANTTKISGMDFKNFNGGGQVRFMARNDNDDYLAVSMPGSTTSATFFGQNTANTSLIFLAANTDADKRLSIGTFTAGDLILGTSNTERVRILATGNVGIGTTVPTAKLHLPAGTATASTAPLKFTSGTLLTAPEAGAVEFLTDKFYATITTGAARKEVQLYDTYYGEMYMYENTTAETVNTNNVYKAIRNFTTGMVAGFTFSAGSTGPIASVADYSGTVAGTILVTDVAHGLVTGNVVTILGTTDYNGKFIITKVTNDTFYVTETYTSSQTGDWYKPSSLTANAGSDGTYRVAWTITADSAGSGETYKMEANKNATALDNLASERNFASGADYGQLTSSGLLSVVSGDVLWLSFKQTTAGTDSLTIRHANFNINRI